MVNKRELIIAGSLFVLAPSFAFAQSKNAAEVAVEAAKKYAGTEISIVWEAGLQSLDPLNYSGPKWEKLTGIKVKVVEVPTGGGIAERYNGPVARSRVVPHRRDRDTCGDTWLASTLILTRKCRLWRKFDAEGWPSGRWRWS